MTSILTAHANGFVNALDELGFGDEETPVSGADTVDVICHYEDLLRKLPALCELADAAERLLKLGTIRQDDYDALIAAHQKLKGV